MNTKPTFHLSRIVVVTLAALAPLASSQAAGESSDPFQRIGYLIGEQNTVSDTLSEVVRIARGAEGPIKSVAAMTEDSASRSYGARDTADAVPAMPPSSSYDPNDRNSPPQP